MDLALSLQAKGGVGLLARVGTVAERFGLTPARMTRYLCDYVAMTDEVGARPSLPITASVLARHPDIIRKFVDRGVEFALHGLVHNDHSELGFDRQVASVGDGMAIFRVAGVPCVGFRAPYLRYNGAIHEAIRSHGLRYHSSQAVAFPVLTAAACGPNGELVRRALQFYRAADAGQVVVRPRDRTGLVDIPIALPDDEIMIDRLRLDPEAQAATWVAILDLTHTRGELFTVQLHPERIPDMAVAMLAVLHEAGRQNPRVWIAQLNEIADWWISRGRATLGVREHRPGNYHVTLHGESRATLLVRGLSAVPAKAWYGRDLLAQVSEFDVQADRKPVVGVSSRTSATARQFLLEEGFPVEVGEVGDRFGAYVDIPTDQFDEIKLLAEIDRGPGPLVRLWRWPAGARSALAVTGDIDSITVQDFLWRVWETRR